MSVMYIRDKDGNLVPVPSIKGEDGASPVATVIQTADGAVISITDANGTTTATVTNGKDGAEGEKGDTGAQDPAGPQGDPYVLTKADKAEIVAMVIESLGGNPVFGYVDENNNIVVSGSLADGTYSIKYEMEDGSTVDIGDLVLDSNVYYSITNTLTNCTNNNSATKAVQGGSYSATISAKSGYELSSVKVTMGGADISASAVSGGTISIANVTGNIVITASATEIQTEVEPVTTNIALTDGIRIGSDGTDRELAGYCATPHIDLTNIPKPCVIRLTNALWCYNESSSMSTVRTYAKNASGTQLVSAATKESISNEHITVVINESTGGTTANDGGKDVSVTVTSNDVASIRFSGMWSAVGASDSSASFAAANTKATLTYTPES